MAGHARSWGEMRARNIYGNSIEIGNLDVDAYSLGLLDAQLGRRSLFRRYRHAFMAPH